MRQHACISILPCSMSRIFSALPSSDRISFPAKSAGRLKLERGCPGLNEIGNPKAGNCRHSSVCYHPYDILKQQRWPARGEYSIHPSRSIPGYRLACCGMGRWTGRLDDGGAGLGNVQPTLDTEDRIGKDSPSIRRRERIVMSMYERKNKHGQARRPKELPSSLCRRRSLQPQAVSRRYRRVLELDQPALSGEQGG